MKFPTSKHACPESFVLILLFVFAVFRLFSYAFPVCDRYECQAFIFLWRFVLSFFFMKGHLLVFACMCERQTLKKGIMFRLLGCDKIHDDDGSRTKNSGKAKLLQLHTEFRINGRNQRLSYKNTSPLYFRGMFDGALERARRGPRSEDNPRAIIAGE